jgi:hypothetical protein
MTNMTNRLWGTLATGLALAAALSACTSSSNHAATGSTTTTTTGATSTTAGPATTAPSSGSSVTTTAAGSSVTSSGTSSPATTAGPGRCHTSSLTGSLAGASGTAGSSYYRLVLTNTGSTACVIQGYAGVSFVTGSNGQQVGAPADRSPGSTLSVLLAPGQRAQAVLQITDAGNYGPSCGITATDGLRVYPPGQTASLLIVHSDKGCSNTRDVTLRVGPFSAST